jgi:hypothetical protein
MTTVDNIKTTTVARTAFDLAGILDYSECDEITEALVVAGRMEPPTPGVDGLRVGSSGQARHTSSP